MNRPLVAADGTEEPPLYTALPDDAEPPPRVSTSIEIQRLKLDLRQCHSRIIDLEQTLEAYQQHLRQSNREAAELRHLAERINP